MPLPLLLGFQLTLLPEMLRQEFLHYLAALYQAKLSTGRAFGIPLQNAILILREKMIHLFFLKGFAQK